MNKDEYMNVYYPFNFCSLETFQNNMLSVKGGGKEERSMARQTSCADDLLWDSKENDSLCLSFLHGKITNNHYIYISKGYCED